MTILILGLVIFLGVHSTRILAGPFRDGQIAASPRRWKGLYSLASGLGFVLIIVGWIKVRPVAPLLYD
ncbi:NnrU family protein, partial [Acinetobacter baumannii]